MAADKSRIKPIIPALVNLLVNPSMNLWAAAPSPTNSSRTLATPNSCSNLEKTMLQQSIRASATKVSLHRSPACVVLPTPTETTDLQVMPSRRSNRSSDRNSARNRDGGNSLKQATSVYPFLQFFAPPPSPILRNTTSKTDVDYYKFFDKKSSNTFQSEGLILGFNFKNLSNANLSFDFLDRDGKVLQGLSRTVTPGRTFVSQQEVSQQAFYLRVRTNAAGRHRYEIALPVINS